MSPRSPLQTLRSHGRTVPAWFIVLSPFVGYLFVDGLLAYVRTDWPTIATDPAFFQHTGWYMLNGGVPYADVWDVNPPVPFVIAAGLAALSGGDMYVLHALALTLTVLVAAASVLLVAWVAFLITGEDAAAVAAGLTMFVVPELFLRSPEGMRAQFYALFFGVSAIALVLRDRPFLAGAAAALSAGSWQSGLAFAPLVIGMALQRGERDGALRAVAGGGVVAGIVLAAFAAAGTLPGMVVQTIVAPLSAGSPYTLAERVYAVLLVFGYGSLLIPVAIVGWIHAAVFDLRERWWVAAGGGILLLQVLFVDMDGSTDTFPWLAFVALGVAVAVDRAMAWGVGAVGRADGADPTDDTDRAGPLVSTDRFPAWTDRRRVVAVAAVLVLVGPLVYGGLVWHHESPPPQATLQSLHDDAEPEGKTPPITPSDGDVPSMQTIYWEKVQPETCHYRLSWNEVRWISMSEDTLDATDCSGWVSRTDGG